MPGLGLATLSVTFDLREIIGACAGSPLLDHTDLARFINSTSQ
jgi:hypothetical protein